MRLFRRVKSFNFATSIPVFCSAYEIQIMRKKNKEKSRYLLMNEDVLHWIKCLSMQMIQVHSQFHLIYVVNLLYSTWLTFEMIEKNKEFNLYTIFFFLPNQRMKRLPHKLMIHYLERPIRKIMTHMSLVTTHSSF